MIYFIDVVLIKVMIITNITKLYYTDFTLQYILLILLLIIITSL